MEEEKVIIPEIIEDSTMNPRKSKYVRRGINPERQNERGRFLPGVTGNPNGRPPLKEEFKLKLREMAIPALETIIGIMNDPGTRTADRIRAAEIILERCYGKAVQPIGGDEQQPLVIKLAGQLEDWSK